MVYVHMVEGCSCKAWVFEIHGQHAHSIMSIIIMTVEGIFNYLILIMIIIILLYTVAEATRPFYCC